MKTSLSKVRPGLLRQMNEQQVLSAIQLHGPLSRADICRYTGVSFPTVTRAVAGLLDAGLLEEGDPRQNGVGRPGKLVRLASTSVGVLGCVIGPRMCEMVTTGLDGEPIPGGERHFTTPARYEDLLSACVAQARALARQSKAAMLAAGISVPGLLNRHEGRSLVSPNVHQLDGRSLGRDLGERLNLEVSLLQECQALCLAEQVYGAARGIADFAMLDISEGLGLGVIHGGELLKGHSGFGGELGHITVELDGRPCGCGNRGCLETVATDSALLALAREATGRAWDIDELIAALRSGELQLDAPLERVLQYLAIGIAAVLNIFNPHRLFIYGRFLDAGDELFPRLLELVGRRALRPNRDDCQIVRAQGSKRLGAVAAAIQAATRVGSRA